MNENDSDYDCDGIYYHRNVELKQWLKIKLLEKNCKNCCNNLSKIFTLEPQQSPPRFFYIDSNK